MKKNYNKSSIIYLVLVLMGGLALMYVANKPKSVNYQLRSAAAPQKESPQAKPNVSYKITSDGDTVANKQPSLVKIASNYYSVYIKDRRIAFSTSKGGSSWGSEKFISPNASTSQSDPKLLACKKELLAFWREGTTALSSYSADGGETWVEPAIYEMYVNNGDRILPFFQDGVFDENCKLYMVGSNIWENPSAPETNTVIVTTDDYGKLYDVTYPYKNKGKMLSKMTYDTNSKVMHVVSTDATNVYYTQSVDGGVTWDPETTVFSSADPRSVKLSGIQVVEGVTSYPVVTWIHNGTNYFARMNSNGSWSEPMLAGLATAGKTVVISDFTISNKGWFLGQVSSVNGANLMEVFKSMNEGNSWTLLTQDSASTAGVDAGSVQGDQFMSYVTSENMGDIMFVSLK